MPDQKEKKNLGRHQCKVRVVLESFLLRGCARIENINKLQLQSNMADRPKKRTVCRDPVPGMETTTRSAVLASLSAPAFSTLSHLSWPVSVERTWVGEVTHGSLNPVNFYEALHALAELFLFSSLFSHFSFSCSINNDYFFYLFSIMIC